MPRTSNPARLLCLLTATVAVLATASPSSARPLLAQRPSASAFTNAFLAQLNAERQSLGLRPLRISRNLTRAASGHAAAMARQGFFSHSSLDGTSPTRRIRHYYGGSTIGETILWRSPDCTPEQAIAMWLASSSHRRLLLRAAFTEIGIGRAHSDAAPGTYGGMPVTVVVADLGAGG